MDWTDTLGQDWIDTLGQTCTKLQGLIIILVVAILGESAD